MTEGMEPDVSTPFAPFWLPRILLVFKELCEIVYENHVDVSADDVYPCIAGGCAYCDSQSGYHLV